MQFKAWLPAVIGHACPGARGDGKGDAKRLLSHSPRLFKLSSFFVGQRDNNAITNATNELKGVPFLADDLVHVMLQRGNYVDRLVSRPQYTAMCSS